MKLCFFFTLAEHRQRLAHIRIGNAPAVSYLATYICWDTKKRIFGAFKPNQILPCLWVLLLIHSLFETGNIVLSKHPKGRMYDPDKIGPKLDPWGTNRIWWREEWPAVNQKKSSLTNKIPKSTVMCLCSSSYPRLSVSLLEALVSLSVSSML